MDSELLTSGMDGRLMNSEQLIHPWNLPNLTHMVGEMMFPPIEDGVVYDRSLTVVGMKEAGKTSLANALASQAVRIYGDQLNIVASYEIKAAMDHMNSKPVQLLIIDDAISQQNSRKSMANADDMAAFFRLRHIYEDRFKTKTGIVISVFLTQRWMGLDVGFRQSHAIIYKSILTDKRDNQGILEFINKRPFEELRRISAEIFQHRDHSMKSTCIACLPFSQRAGHYYYQYEPSWLKFLKAGEDIFVDGTRELFLFDRRDQIMKLLKDKDWRTEAKAYYLATFETDKYPRQADVAKELGESQQMIAYRIKRIRGELSRLAGTEYELFKSRQLEAQGFAVEHRGGTGEPDIIADKAGMRRVYSCKCLEFVREIGIELEEVMPEIQTARRLGLSSFYLTVYNLATRKEWEHEYELAQLPVRLVVPT